MTSNATCTAITEMDDVSVEQRGSPSHLHVEVTASPPELGAGDLIEEVPFLLGNARNEADLLLSLAKAGQQDERNSGQQHALVRRSTSLPLLALYCLLFELS